MRCASGMHEWIDRDCAGKCCNGWKEILVESSDPMYERAHVRTTAGEARVGYVWVPQTLRDWVDSAAVRQTLHGVNVRCLELERQPDGRVKAKLDATGLFAPRWVEVPAAVRVPPTTERAYAPEERVPPSNRSRGFSPAIER